MLSALLRDSWRRASLAATFGWGKRALKAGAFRKALGLFERCIALDPLSADYRYHAAAAHHMLDDTAHAQARCEEALALDANHHPSHHLLAALTLPGAPYTAHLAALHQSLVPRTYVEIGVASGRSLVHVQPATRVVGIDPAPRLEAPPGPNVQVHAMKSDDYFATRDVRADLGGLPIDLAFIDGSHLFEQALRDFINVERNATPDSTILLHDTYPLTRFTAERTPQSWFWSGDVWRLVLILKKYRPDLAISNVAAVPTGLCVVHGLDPASRVLAERHDAIVEEFMAVDYSVLDADKPALLNLVPNEIERTLRLAGAVPA